MCHKATWIVYRIIHAHKCQPALMRTICETNTIMPPELAPTDAIPVLVARTVPVRAHTDLAALVEVAFGHHPGRLSHACPSCGSSAHGRPLFPEAPGVHVSLARASDHSAAAIAVCETTAIGIDIEAKDAAAFPGFADVALHPEDPSHIDHTRMWVRKEAFLKAHHRGLAIDPRQVRITADGTVLAGLDGQIFDLEHWPGYRAALAVRTDRAVRIRHIILPIDTR